MVGIALPMAMLAAFQIAGLDSGLAGHWRSVGTACTLEMTLHTTGERLDGTGTACAGPRGLRMSASGAWTPPRVFILLQVEGMRQSHYAGQLVAQDTLRGTLDDSDSLVLVRVPGGEPQSDSAFAANATETRPSQIPESCVPPEYPPQLRQDGRSGTVVLQFIIDTAGIAESNSISVLSSDHPLFNAPARIAVLTCRFHPGRINGRAVRVRVQQPINFRIDRMPMRRP